MCLELIWWWWWSYPNTWSLQSLSSLLGLEEMWLAFVPFLSTLQWFLCHLLNRVLCQQELLACLDNDDSLLDTTGKKQKKWRKGQNKETKKQFEIFNNLNFLLWFARFQMMLDWQLRNKSRKYPLKQERQRERGRIITFKWFTDKKSTSNYC